MQSIATGLIQSIHRIHTLDVDLDGELLDGVIGVKDYLYILRGVVIGVHPL